jgi:hypothetical protein
LILTAAADRPVADVFEVARQLVRAGVSVRAAKKSVDELAGGKLSYVVAPSVMDYDALKRRVKRENVVARQIRLRAIDVKAASCNRPR